MKDASNKKENLEKKLKEKEIDEFEFEDEFLNKIYTLENKLNLIENDYASTIKLYNKFLFDKRRYTIRYYKKGNKVYYKCFLRGKIGFK